MIHRQPATVRGTARNTLLDEVHAFDTVVHIGIDGVGSFDLLARFDVDHRIKSSAVDVSERFEERLRVPTG